MELRLTLWGVTCHMGSQSVTRHLTSDKSTHPTLTPTRGWYSI